MAKIVVACGSGVATSETVVGLIKGFLDDHNISGVEVEATDFKGLASVLPKYDIYVWICWDVLELHACRVRVSPCHYIPWADFAGVCQGA